MKKFFYRLFLVILMTGCLAGGFFLGRFSMLPQFSELLSSLPPVSTMPLAVSNVQDSPDDPTLPPEETVRFYFEAALDGDMKGVLKLWHPEKNRHDEQVVDFARDIAKELPPGPDIKFLKVDRQGSAKVVIEALDKYNHLETMEFYLQVQDKHWRITGINR